MMNSLPLMNTAPSMAQLLLFLLLSLLLALFVLRRRQASNKLRVAAGPVQELTMSAYSELEISSSPQEDVDPLTEAEIYLIYGRKKDAQQVLDLAMREGRITPADVVRFWSGQKPA